MAAGIGDPFAGSDGPALVRGQFRIAVGPVITGPVSCGSVDDTDVRIVDQGDGFDRARVRQTEEYDIRVVEEFLSFRQVVTLVFIDAQEGQVFPAADPFINLQACSSGLAVNIYFCLHFT